MMGCKARCCIQNPDLHYEAATNVTGRKWNDFERCSKPVHEDGFCPLHYGPGRCRPSWPFQGREWERDGIHGQPYHFPHHTVTVGRKQWVEMIYTLHPHIRPPVPEDPEDPEEPEEPVTEEPVPEEEEEPVTEEPVTEEVSSEEKIAKVLIWLDNNAEKINYKLGSELKELLS
jgi:hypothetical protein